MPPLMDYLYSGINPQMPEGSLAVGQSAAPAPAAAAAPSIYDQLSQAYQEANAPEPFVAQDVPKEPGLGDRIMSSLGDGLIAYGNVLGHGNEIGSAVQRLRERRKQREDTLAANAKGQADYSAAVKRNAAQGKLEGIKARYNDEQADSKTRREREDTLKAIESRVGPLPPEFRTRYLATGTVTNEMDDAKDYGQLGRMGIRGMKGDKHGYGETAYQDEQADRRLAHAAIAEKGKFVGFNSKAELGSHLRQIADDIYRSRVKYTLQPIEVEDANAIGGKKTVTQKVPEPGVTPEEAFAEAIRQTPGSEQFFSSTSKAPGEQKKGRLTLDDVRKQLDASTAE